MPPQERRHEEVFGLGDSFTRPELGNDIGLMGALLPFVLRVVAGACVGRWTGQPRMPPRERQHEGLGGLGDSFTCSGATARGGFWFGGFFHTPGAWERHRFNGGAVAVCFEGCCGSMCWPRERPATHAAAGAAARGALIFCFGDCFTCSGVVRHACRHRVTARGVFGLGGLFHTPGAWERHRIVSSAPSRCVLRSGASHSPPRSGTPSPRVQIPPPDGSVCHHHRNPEDQCPRHLRVGKIHLKLISPGLQSIVAAQADRAPVR